MIIIIRRYLNIIECYNIFMLKFLLRKLRI